MTTIVELDDREEALVFEEDFPMFIRTLNIARASGHTFMIERGEDGIVYSFNTQRIALIYQPMDDDLDVPDSL